MEEIIGNIKLIIARIVDIYAYFVYAVEYNDFSHTVKQH